MTQAIKAPTTSPAAAGRDDAGQAQFPLEGENASET